MSDYTYYLYNDGLPLSFIYRRKCDFLEIRWLEFHREWSQSSYRMQEFDDLLLKNELLKEISLAELALLS